MSAATRLSLDEYLALEETKPYLEFVCGEVVPKPMPDDVHAFIQFFLASVLRPFLSRTKLGRGGSEWRFIFGPPGQERAFVPDVSVVLQDRLTPGNSLVRQHLRLAPDLAIEILSPNQHAGHFADKLQFYLRHGVRLVWVIDPDGGKVFVFSPDADPQTLTAGDVLDGGDVLPGFSLPVADIFAELEIDSAPPSQGATQ
jgi:Uma2 family endonuclease